MPFPYIIKMSRSLRGTFQSRHSQSRHKPIPTAPKKLSKFAWRLAIDRYVQRRVHCCPILIRARSYRSLVNLSYPPHVVALACLYLAALLSSFEQGQVPAQAGLRNAHEIAKLLGDRGQWETQLQARVEDLEGQ